MPGQRKRKRKERDSRARTAARTAPDKGHWEVVFETRDVSEFNAHLRGLRAGKERFDGELARIDTLCGRLSHPTVYRLSMFVPYSAGDPDRERLEDGSCGGSG